MVEERLKLEPEVQEIFKLIDDKKNFHLSGGAGSGKTYSLVQVIKQVIMEHPTAKIACMTYTNAAVREIDERVNNRNLIVSTIHDFLWDNIKHFQSELKKTLVDLVNDEEESLFKITETPTIEYDYFDNLKVDIQYKEYLKIKEGIVSHDQIIVLANRLFRDYPKLSDITKDKYPFVFIDEYQDTQKEVVEILLSHFEQSQKVNIIGFFGDSMQSIYDNGIGDLSDYSDKVIEVEKEQNRRNPQCVIDLANTLRTDGIQQVPSNDSNAPNLDKEGKIKQGDIKFIYSESPELVTVRTFLGWDFNNTTETKELNLTHNLIADKAKIRSLMDIYDKDQILKFRNKIKKYILKEDIADDFLESTFGEVIEALQLGKTGRELNKVSPTPAMQSFIEANPVLMNYARLYNYKELCRIYIDKDQLLDDKKQDEDDPLALAQDEYSEMGEFEQQDDDAYKDDDGGNLPNG